MTPSRFVFLLVFLLFIRPMSGAAESAVVLQVIDGDTIELSDGRRVRYLGIQAPEKGDPLAEEATRANNALVGGKEVRLVPAKSAKDRDGRVLACIFVGQTLVNAEIVRKGLAHVRRPVAMEYREQLLQAQHEARRQGRGIWARVNDRGLVVTAVQARPAEEGKGNLNGEFIVIENQGDRSVTMTGWTLTDETTRRYLFPKFVLKAGARVTIHSGLGKNSESELHWGSRSPIWNDDGDTIFLRDANGKLVLSHVY